MYLSEICNSLQSRLSYVFILQIRKFKVKEIEKQSKAIQLIGGSVKSPAQFELTPD